jgi:hypothetical protein
MDENKPRRRWLSFGIRDLLWAMAVVGLGGGWWVDQTDLRLRLDRATRIIGEMEGARESHWHQLKQAHDAYAYLKRDVEMAEEDARQQRALVTEYHARWKKCQGDSAEDD